MHRANSIVLRALPLAMTSYELIFGIVVICARRSGAVPGRFLVSLASITFAIYCVVAVSMRQLEGFRQLWLWPLMAYCGAAAVTVWGIVILATEPEAVGVVSGHMVLGAGLIALCVSTVSVTSVHFIEIARNQAHFNIGRRNRIAWSTASVWCLTLIPFVISFIALAYAIVSMCASRVDEQIGGHALFAQSMVCLSFASIVHILARQMNNTFLTHFKWRYSVYIVCNGFVNITWGLVTLLTCPTPFITCGFGMIALGLVCLSVSGKAHRVIGSWHDVSELAYVAAYFPLFAGILGMLMSSILFSTGIDQNQYVWAAYTVAGLSAVCISAYAMVAIPSVDPDGDQIGERARRRYGIDAIRARNVKLLAVGQVVDTAVRQEHIDIKRAEAADHQAAVETAAVVEELRANPSVKPEVARVLRDVERQQRVAEESRQAALREENEIELSEKQAESVESEALRPVDDNSTDASGSIPNGVSVPLDAAREGSTDDSGEKSDK
ncbi:MAG: DUF2776 family protein [Aeriscardovia sp.]|nr:DUF2776 family protein [Aeriscardovia sp.]